MNEGVASPPERAPRVEDLLERQPRLRRGGRRRSRWRALALLAAAALLGASAAGTGFRYEAPSPARRTVEEPPSEAEGLKKFIARQSKQRAQLEARLARLAPKGVYIVIDQTQNRLYLKRDGETLHEAVCSAGSGMVLQEAEGGKNRRWVFDTPRGVFKVQRRIEDPVWSKPDWAFVEEGKPIPKDPGERIEEGVLGEYALYLERGYMIHGTLYERLLGRSVTHGCIRLGRDDLRRVWAETKVGSPVYIY